MALLALAAGAMVVAGHGNVIPDVEARHTIKAHSGRFEYLTGKSREPAAVIAERFLREKLAGLEYKVTDRYMTKQNNVTHVYVRQVVAGLEVANAFANINVDRHGRVVNLGESFFKSPAAVSTAPPKLNAAEAMRILSRRLNISTETKTKVEELMLVQTGGALRRVWHLNVDVFENWWDAYVDCENGEVVYLMDWVQQALYNVYPLPENDPDDGPMQLVTDPWSGSVVGASPLGWQDQGTQQFETTAGNNVYAQENWSGGSAWQNNYRPTGGPGHIFNFVINFNLEPKEYADASITNLFYWNNIVHDIFYGYGFDEVAGNFQENNFDKGGLGGDAVQANAQDGAGYNNANFATPPDGQRPRMRMYLWNQVTPMIDGDLDNGIIVHEYGHGITNRLTGGPSNVNCLGGGQAGGMGEGWSDAFAVFFRWKPQYTRDQTFGMGTYAAGQGIRPYPYAYSMTINPQLFDIINTTPYSGVHAKGAVWCTVLYDLFLDMIEQYSFDPNWWSGTGGNNRLLRILVHAQKIQICNPGFLDSRDAMIAADELEYSGANFCLIWRAFARRGMGSDAVGTPNNVVNGFTPSNC